MKRTSKILGTVIAASIAIGTVPLTELPIKAVGEAETTPKTIMAGVSGIKDEQKSNIYYGNYQQESLDLKGGNEPNESIHGKENEDWRKCDTAKQKGRNGYYELNPIKWRVLKKDEQENNKNLFLLADQNLDVFWFDDDGKSNESGTNPNVWRISPIREWLNGTGSYSSKLLEGQTELPQGYQNHQNFIDYAFSEEEKGYIKETTQKTEGKDEKETTDKIFLLEIKDVKENYGFGAESTDAGKETRKSINTSYVVGGGKTRTTGMNCEGSNGVGVADLWWLRSPGNN